MPEKKPRKTKERHPPRKRSFRKNLPKFHEIESKKGFVEFIVVAVIIVLIVIFLFLGLAFAEPFSAP